MRITAVRTHLVAVPMNKVVVTGLGSVGRKDELYVVVETDEGISGLGCSYVSWAPSMIEAAIREEIAPIVIGRDALDIQGAWDAVFGTLFSQGAATALAMSGVDIALWDILGKTLGAPIHQLLGAGGRPELPAYVGCMNLGIQPVGELTEEAIEYAEAGFLALKLRGGAGVERDVAAVRAVRAALPDVDIMVDANSAYNYGDALRLARKLEEFDLKWLEDPFDYTVAYHHNQMGKLTAQSPVPICSGGNLFTRFEFQSLLEAGGVHYVTPDATKCGGISEAMRIAAMASAQGVMVAPHTLAGLASVANIHFTAAIPSNVRSYIEWDPTVDDVLQTRMLKPAVEVRDGLLLAPTGPGLGVELDAELSLTYAATERKGEVVGGHGARGEGVRLRRRYPTPATEPSLV